MIKFLISLFVVMFCHFISLAQNQVYHFSGSYQFKGIQFLTDDSTLLISSISGNSDPGLGLFPLSGLTGSGVQISTPSVYEDNISFVKSVNGNYFIGSYGNSSTLFVSAKDSAMQPIFTRSFLVNSGIEPAQLRLTEFADSSLIGAAGNTIFRFRRDGSLLWKKEASGISFHNVHLLTQDEVLITGKIQYGNGINSAGEYFVCRMDSAANFVWSKSLGATTDEQIETSFIKNGFLYLAGSANSFGAQNLVSPCLLKMDFNGNLVWAKYASLLENHQIVSLSVNNLNQICAIIKDNLNLESYYTLMDHEGQLLQFYKLNINEDPIVGEFLNNEFFIGGQDSNNSPVFFFTSGKRPPQCLRDSSQWVSFSDFAVSSVHLQNPALTNNSLISQVNVNSGSLSYNAISSCSLNCALSAEIICNKTRICSNDTVQFSAFGNNLNQTIWLVNQQYVSSAANFSHHFQGAGLYRIMLIAGDGSCTDSVEMIIEVIEPLQPVFSWQSHLLDFTFFGLNNTGEINWLWSFGDGDSLISAGPVRHIFPSAGTYTVCAQPLGVCNNQNYCQNITINYPSDHAFYSQINASGSPQLAYSIIQLKNGHYLVGGQTEYNFSNPTGFIYEADSAGNAVNMLEQQMIKNTSSDFQYVTGFEQKKDGNVFFTGYHTYFLSGTKHFFGEINRNLLPNTRYISANSAYDYDSFLIPGIDNGAYFAHTIQGIAHLGEYNAAGQIIWRTELAGSNVVKKLFLLPDGTLKVVCSNSGNTGIGIVHTTSLGQILNAWTYTLATGSLSLYDAVISPNGDLLVAGGDGTNPLVFRSNSFGQILWVKRINYLGGSFKHVNCLAELSDGRLAGSITEGFSSLNGPSYLFSLDTTGNLLSFKKDNARIVDLAATSDSSLVALMYGSALPTTYGICKFNRALENDCFFTPENANVQSISLNETSWASVFNGSNNNSTTTGTGSYYSYSQPVNSTTCYQTYGAPTANFIWGNTCANDTVVFTNSSSGSWTISNWTFPMASASGFNGDNAWAVWSNSGDYSVSLEVSDSLNNSDSISYLVSIAPEPVLNLQDVSICLGDSVILNPSAVGTNLSFSWSPSSGLSDTATSLVMAYPLINTQYILWAQSPEGCVGIDSALVNVAPLPVVYAVVPDTICAGDSVRFYGSGTPILNWFANGLPIGSSDTTAWMTFVADASITLSGTDSVGCTSSITQWLIIDSCQVITGNFFNYLSNVSFYPNPVSNQLTVKNPGKYKISVSLIDATGKMVFCDNLPPESNQVFYFSNYSPGIYLLQVSDGTSTKSNKISILKSE